MPPLIFIASVDLPLFVIHFLPLNVPDSLTIFPALKNYQAHNCPLIFCHLLNLFSLSIVYLFIIYLSCHTSSSSKSGISYRGKR